MRNALRAVVVRNFKIEPFVVAVQARDGIAQPVAGQRQAVPAKRTRPTRPFSRPVAYSQSFVLKPRLVAFSVTARLIWSLAPAGNSALISTVMLSEALASLARTLMISSAT